MTNASHPGAPNGAPAAEDPLSLMEQSVTQLNTLLAETNSPPAPDVGGTAYENRLVEVRLGIASGLFAALRHKHAPTAAHSLRVALGCSSWAFALGVEPQPRDELEVAALLHDVGKIGAPDRLLLKPGALDGEEVTLMDHYRLSGLDLLANCCPSSEIVDIIRHSAAWYDGSRPNYPRAGKEIPSGSRMLAIVDAFDSMTTDQVYRRAMSRERALHELFRHAGTQFDPDLIKSFSELRITVPLNREIVGHWLQSLDPQKSNRFWRKLDGLTAPPTELLFQQKLLDNMHDAVVFVDRSLRILQWNRGAERLTGIASSSVVQHTWSPTLIGMRDDQKGPLGNEDCPIAYSINSGVQSLRRLVVANRHRRPVAVDVHTVPVVDQDGTTYGATMLIHDASPEASLEEQCQNLHERATKDPLTQIANRAEFDRTQQLFVDVHLERKLPCSLIMCDIDHFKSINDTFGHQAGDAVLTSFGHVLKSECRPGDLVARYGGEEFVMLCADCNNAAAARRAEQIRATVATLSHTCLSGRAVTVSFGVTEIQPGDTPDSMLRRADRALLEAKRLGRNTVVQLGDGIGDSIDMAFGELSPARSAAGDAVVEQVLVTDVPMNIAVEKLRGFYSRPSRRGPKYQPRSRRVGRRSSPTAERSTADRSAHSLSRRPHFLRAACGKRHERWPLRGPRGAHQGANVHSTKKVARSKTRRAARAGGHDRRRHSILPDGQRRKRASGAGTHLALRKRSGAAGHRARLIDPRVGPGTASVPAFFS